MKVQKGDPQLPAALHLVDKGITGLFKCIFSRMAQVDKVAVMGQNMLQNDTNTAAVFLKHLNTFFRQWFCMPLPLIFNKQGKCPGTDFLRIQGAFSTPPAALTWAPTRFIHSP